MKNLKYRLHYCVLLLLILGARLSAFAQITPSQDSYVNTNSPSTNYGTSPFLNLVSSGSSIQTTFLKFDLSSVPAGYTGANIAKATLRLYVSNVTAAGSFNVHLVGGNWSEKTITDSLSPVVGATIASVVPLTSANVENYVQVDVTAAVKEWLDGTPNDGLALVPNSPLTASFESKENTKESQPAELDIVFNNGLPNSCASGQILQWNGSAWACAAEDKGSVTSVGLSAPASDFTVSGSPITSSGILNFNWNVPPTSGNEPFAIVKRDGSGNFSAQGVSAVTVNSALVTSNQVTSQFAAPNQNLMFAENTDTTSWNVGIWGQTDTNAIGAAGALGEASAFNGLTFGVEGTTNSDDVGSGVAGIAANSSGFTHGVIGASNSPNGTGVYGMTVSPSNTGTNKSGAGVWGDSALTGGFGILGTVDDGTAGLFLNNSNQAALYAQNNGTGNSFFAINSSTGGFCDVDPAGNLNCTGAKHAVVPIDGGQRKVALAAIESPKNWFEDLGSAQLSAGSATVTLEPDFAQTVNTGMEYHVFLTPNGDCKGLYVSQTTAGSFEVHELGGGSSNVSFDYRIVALRKNFENIRLEDHTKDFELAKLLKNRGTAKVAPAKMDMSKLMPHAKPVPNTRPITQKTVK